MTNILAEAINCNDGDQAARIIQDALGIESPAQNDANGTSPHLRCFSTMSASGVTTDVRSRRPDDAIDPHAHPVVATIQTLTSRLGKDRLAFLSSRHRRIPPRNQPELYTTPGLDQLLRK